MKIYIKNLYGIDDEKKAYFRKQGAYCFDFVWNEKDASDLTKEEAQEIMKHKEYYKKIYNASDIDLED